MSALLELFEVSKRFGSTQALDLASFELLPGEVHALLGENGAGKSTALGLMYGVVQPDSGEVRVGGKARTIASPADAQSLGIGCVFQELSLADGISVAENIFAGRPPARWGLIDKARMRELAKELLASFDIDIDVEILAGRLPVSIKQVIEIAKALSMQSRILLLDEPTSALTPDEVTALHVLIRKLTARGIGVVYVSHHLPEIFRIADRITVLRDGRTISTRRASETNEDRVVAEMIGRPAARASIRPAARQGDVVLSVRDFVLEPSAPVIDFDMHRGEIIGLAGAMGSGSGLLAQALAGVAPYIRGRIEVAGRPVPPNSIGAARDAGIAYVPDERKSQGLFLDFSIADNVTSATLSHHTRFGLWQGASARQSAEEAITRFSIKAHSPSVAVGDLSGGNQQKVMLAKWFELKPRLLIVNEPTKGVDVGAKLQIHDVLRSCADEGMAILVVSSDIPELLALADRILVVQGSGIVAETDASTADETILLTLAAGAEKDRREGMTAW